MNYDGWFNAWLSAAAKLNPGPQKVALVLGPQDAGQTRILQKVLDKFQPAHPDFDIVDKVYTNYQAPDTYTKMQSYLQAHNDVTVIISIDSPDVTQGVVKALDQSGRQKNIVVDDLGGAQYTLDAIKAGTIQMTMLYWPVSAMVRSIDSLVAAVENPQTVQPRFIDDEQTGTPDNPLIITKDNVATAPSQG